ncbi:MAG: hypothetical protein AAFU85_12775 [Planctomycetota bacterium]
MSENEMTSAASLRERFPIAPTESNPRVAFYQMGYEARVAEEKAERVTAPPNRRVWTHVGVGLAAAALAFVMGVSTNSPQQEGSSIAQTTPRPQVEAAIAVDDSAVSSEPIIKLDRSSKPGGFRSVRSIDFVWNATANNFTLTAGGLQLAETTVTERSNGTWRASRALSDFETEI